MLQLRGSSLPDWLDVLPPLPDSQWTAIGRHVADVRTAPGGTAPG